MPHKQKYLMDFFGGSHGNFLAYVVNCWIFESPRTDSLFSHTGACHGAKLSREYQRQSGIVCDHFSQFDIEVFRVPDKVIRIEINDFVGRCCRQINVIHRAGDIPMHVKQLKLPQDILSNTTLLRNDWYSKLLSSKYACALPTQWKFKDIPALVVNMSSLYNFFLFLETLENIACFLHRRFSPDQELFVVWREFMERNQGWTAWTVCNDLLQDIIANRDRTINISIEQQALLNVLLSKACGIFDGKLFDQAEYPTNTREIYNLL